MVSEEEIEQIKQKIHSLTKRQIEDIYSFCGEVLDTIED